MTKLTVKAKITDDSKTKLSLIESEYWNYQTYLRSGRKNAEGINLYSATKQQAERVFKRIKEQPKPNKQYPLVLRRDLVDIQKDSKFPCVYWMKIPVYPKSINVRIQTPCKYDLSSKEYSIRESKIVKIQNDWYIYVTIEKQEHINLDNTLVDNVLAIDLGCKHIAVTVNMANTRPNFYGKVVRANADYNGAMNILQRGLGILSSLGGCLTYPRPSVIVERNKVRAGSSGW
jgi:transposase